MIRVVFVCLGNICRSPMAEAVFRKMTDDAGLSDSISADSCGTSGWHTGSRPHSDTVRVLQAHGVSCNGIYASRLSKEHFGCDYIIAMDEDNLHDIRAFTFNGNKPETRLLSYYAKGGWVSVPDPWITGDFESVYKLIAEGCGGLLLHIEEKHRLRRNV